MAGKYTSVTLADLKEIVPGMFVRITQQVQMEGGLLFTPNPDRVFWDAVDAQQREFGKLGYVVILDRDMEGPAAGHPFSDVVLADLGGPLSGWIPVGDGPNGEPAYEMFFQWFIVSVQEPDPAVLQAGFPLIWAAIIGVAVLLLGGAVVIWQTREFLVEAGDDLRGVLGDTTDAGLKLGAVAVVVLLLLGR